MEPNGEMVSVDATNVAQHGFFCYKSKKKATGYREKSDWLQARFAEGLKIKMIYEGKRSVGFIEYIPGEFAWRAIDAPNYLVIHCLWVVGSGKGKGYGSRLIDACVEDAREAGKDGVAVVTSSGVWLAHKDIFASKGFELQAEAPPSFQLMVRAFGDGPRPSFPTDWEERSAQFGAGVTVVRTAQCPYIADAVDFAVSGCKDVGLDVRVVELHSRQEVRDRAPAANGIFGIVYNGKLLSYHYLLPKDLVQRLEQVAR